LVVPVTAPLACSTGSPPAEPVTVTARLTTKSQNRVTALGIGQVGQPGGLCAAADAILPRGWQTPGRATGWFFTGGVLDLTVAGLPAGGTRIASVEAAGVRLPQVQTPPGVDGGVARLRLGAPSAGCPSAGIQPVVPTGLEVNVETPAGLRTSHVSVGAAVAQWLMDAFAISCPARSGNPALSKNSSALRPSRA
jgi:hypothetical protein